MDVLTVEGLSKRYGSHWAVRDLSFAVGEGEVVGFLGQNGAGKSTTIKIVCGLVRPTEGDVRLNGVSVLHGNGAASRRHLGAIVESPRFYPQLSGRRNLELIARIHGVPAERMQTLLAQVGLSERQADRFGKYSMGMKQRLGLAAVLLHAPTVILLDEPTNGLDPVGTRQIQELIREMVRRHGVSVLLCTHQMDEVAALCHRALVLHEGRLMMEQSLAEPSGIAAIRNRFDELARTAAPA